jgi:ankyrin repeat protein
MNAVRWGHSECIRVLLDHGADVTLQSTSGGTAWSLAVCAEHPETEVIQWLQDAAAQATPIEPPS